MKHSTPILSAVKRQHREDDEKAKGASWRPPTAYRRSHADDDAKRGFDPYNRGSRRYVDPESNITDAQKADASAILSCYTTELTLEDKS